MAKINLKRLSETLKDSAGSLKSSASEAVKTVQEKTPTSVKEIDVKESLKGMIKKGNEALKKHQKESEKTNLKAKEILSSERKVTDSVSPYAALKVIYYLIAVDGNVDVSELEKFDAIGQEVYPEGFTDVRNEIVESCDKELTHFYDAEDYYSVVHDCISKTLFESKDTGEAVPIKSLLWNLVATAFSDEEYSDNEKKLIRYIARLYEIEPVIISEMEATVMTLIDMQQEEQFLKNSDRQYKEIEEQLKELNIRRSRIMQGIRALIVD